MSWSMLVACGPGQSTPSARTSPRLTFDYLPHRRRDTIYMVTDPGRFDVIVTDNLFGDIITDLAGAVTGGNRLGGLRQHRS